VTHALRAHTRAHAHTTPQAMTHLRFCRDVFSRPILLTAEATVLDGTAAPPPPELTAASQLQASRSSNNWSVQAAQSRAVLITLSAAPSPSNARWLCSHT